MPEQKDKALAALTAILRGLKEGPYLYDAHPLAEPLFLSKFIEGLEPFPPVWPDVHSNGYQLFQALRLVLWNALHQSHGFAHQRGPFLVWSTKIESIEHNVNFPSPQQIIASFRSDPGGLVNLLRKLELINSSTHPSPQDQKVIDAFAAEFSALEPANARKLINNTLRQIIQRIQRTADALGSTLQDVLPVSWEPPRRGEEVRSPRTAIRGPESKATGEAASIEATKALLEVAVPLDSFLCRQDYLGYIKRQRTALSESSGMSVREPLIRRRAYRLDSGVVYNMDELVSQAEKWVAVAGERGSGRTVALLHLAEQATGSTGIFIDARDYAEVAPQVPLYEYVSEQLYGRDPTGEFQRRNLVNWLEREDKEKRLFWLVDDLMLLALEDRKWIIRQLQRSNGHVIFAAPINFVDDDAHSIFKSQPLRYDLVPFDNQDIEQFADSWGAEEIRQVDRILLRRVCREVPELAATPLGLLTICEQLASHQSDCATVSERYIAKLYLRDHLTEPVWHVDFDDASPHVRALWLSAEETFYWRKIHGLQGEPVEFVYRKGIIDSLNREVQGNLLNGVNASPLLGVVPHERTWRWVNRQVYVFLVASVLVQGYFSISKETLAASSDGALIGRYTEALYERGWRRSPIPWRHQHVGAPSRSSTL